MESLQHFWRSTLGRSDLRLEADSLLGRFTNRFLLAPLLNAFPSLASRLFSSSHGELARLLFKEREGGSFLVLDTMYEYEGGKERREFLHNVMMHSPAIRAARNRRRIAQVLLATHLQLAADDRPMLVLAVGSGSGRLEAEVLGEVRNRNVYYCGLDIDPRAVAATEATLRQHHLTANGIALAGTINGHDDVANLLEQIERRLGLQFPGIDITMCHGVAEYLDLCSTANAQLSQLVRVLHTHTRQDGALVISQTHRHDRVHFLESALGWHMRLRDADEFRAVIESAGWNVQVCEKEPMGLISMCLAAKDSMPIAR